MKKFILTLTLLVLTLTVFAAKYLYYTDFENGLSHFVNVDHFSIITLEQDKLTFSNSDTNSYNNDSFSIQITNQEESQKLERLQYLVSNGYIVKGEEGNKYFGNNSVRNLTVNKVKEIKKLAFLNDFYSFIDSNDSFFNLDNWINDFSNAIPVDVD